LPKSAVKAVFWIHLPRSLPKTSRHRIWWTSYTLSSAANRRSTRPSSSTYRSCLRSSSTAWLKHTRLGSAS